jgi:hypothetical protein
VCAFGDAAGFRLQQELTAFLARYRTQNPKLTCPIVEELTHLDSAISTTMVKRGDGSVISDHRMRGACARSDQRVISLKGVARPRFHSSNNGDQSNEIVL